MGIYGHRFDNLGSNIKVELTESDIQQYDLIMNYITENDTEYLEESNAVDLDNTDFDYKNLKAEDLDSEEKLKELFLNFSKKMMRK